MAELGRSAHTFVLLYLAHASDWFPFLEHVAIHL